MRMSLKAQTHFHTICKVQVITPHGTRKQFGMVIFVHEKTSAQPPDDLTPLPCLSSHMNWLWNPRLTLSDPKHAYTPTQPSRCVSDAAPHLCCGIPYLNGPVSSEISFLRLKIAEITKKNQ
ncbi:hypothetical protein O181_089821 [Austropuccinia psidii MF-1]|uniref:Uncharacterized protein n=1 Tax=Austropuccinia psidii MF-1 TaxID=1389203 RepID=A0A9Q3IU79_9BASI|nr:hypothetical protein [Austropuccinia psidii MF-1]